MDMNKPIKIQWTSRQRRVIGWVSCVGWAVKDMLCLLERGKRIEGMPKGRDRYLEKYLPMFVEMGVLKARKYGRKLAYYLPGYKTGRKPNLEHGMNAAWILTYLACSHTDCELVPLPLFYKGRFAILPDGGIILNLEDARHLFLVEYQSEAEAERTTLDKVYTYLSAIESFKDSLEVQKLWVVFVLDKEREWVEGLVTLLDNVGNLFFFCDRDSFFSNHHTQAFTKAIFFWSGHWGQYSLLDKDSA